MLIMECRYYQKLDDGRVECTLCPHHCRIAEGKTGVCRSRRNQGGMLVSEVYGKPIGVLNGFCCPVRLRQMGESLQSAHMRGEAADICALVTDGWSVCSVRITAR